MKIIIEGSAEEIKKYRDLIGNEVSIEIKKETSFKVGDTVKALANGLFGDVKAGDIGKITSTVSGGTRPIEVTTDDDHDHFHPQDLVKATDEEVAQAKRDAVFARLGRKPNEFKKGDIVRFNEDTGAEGFKEGSIAEIETRVVGKDFEFGNGCLGYTDWIELVAPVEARVDR